MSNSPAAARDDKTKATPRRPSASANMSATRRAAIIIAMLSEPTAKNVMDKLDDVSLGKIIAELDHIPYMKRGELIDVIIDFLSHLRETSGAFIGGREATQEIVGKLVKLRQAEREDKENALPSLPDEDPADPVATDSVWLRLQKRDSQQIGDYLSNLTPNLISMILRKLPAVKCSEVLDALENDMLRKVMGYMIQPDRDDPELDAVVGRMVEMEFLNTAQGQSDERSEHLQTIGEILSLVPSERRDAVVDFLKAEHEETLVHIQKSLFTIDAIPSILPRAAVPVVFREIDMDQTIRLIASLQGEHSEIADFLLSNISSRMADMIRDELGSLGTLSEEEAEDTQRMFIGKLMELKRLGKIETMKEAS